MSTWRRVVVTGMGVVSPLGCSVPEAWKNLLAGVSGIGPLTRFDASEYRSRIAGEVKNFDISRYLDVKEANRLDLYCHYAVAAAHEALTQAGLLNNAEMDFNRAGTGRFRHWRHCHHLPSAGSAFRARLGRVSPMTIPMLIADMGAGFRPSNTVSRNEFRFEQCLRQRPDAIGEASWIIRRNDADVMLTGAVNRPGSAEHCCLFRSRLEYAQ